MKRIYRKIDPGIMLDLKFMSMSTEARLIFFCSLSHPKLNSVGAMIANVDGLAQEIWGRYGIEKQFGKRFRERFREPFDELFRNGLIKYDESVSFWWMPNWIKYNLPENPNIVKSWEKSIAYLPECELRNELVYNIQELGKDEKFGKWLPDDFQERFAKPFRNGLPNGSLNGLPNHITITHNNNINNNTRRSATNWFDEFWELYPKKRYPKDDTRIAYNKVIKTIEDHFRVIEAVKMQIKDHELAVKYSVFHPEWPDPIRYVKKQRWNDKILGEEYFYEKNRQSNSKRNQSAESSFEDDMQSSYTRLEYEISGLCMDET